MSPTESAARRVHLQSDPSQAPDSPGEQGMELEQVARVAHAQLEETVRTYPYAAVAAGVGVGVVLGRGIPTWALRLVGATAGRMAMAYAAKRLAEPETS